MLMLLCYYVNIHDLAASMHGVHTTLVFSSILNRDSTMFFVDVACISMGQKT